MSPRPVTTRRPTTTRRLGRVVGRERRMLVGLLVFGLLNVALTAAGPWLLGRATDLVLGGALGRRFQAGTTADGAIERLRAEGHGTLADVLGTVPFTPGHGVDFGAVGRMLLAATLVYVAAGLCGVLQAWLANVVSQRVLERLRDEVEDKIHRVPLEYFDRQRRGDVLSRVTNDLDNLGQALQLVLGQFVVPGLSIVGMLAVMFWVSWLLALIALVTAPLSVLVVALVVRRAQPAYARQWRHTGELNGHIEEMFAGHALLKVFGQEQAASETFAEGNEQLSRATVRAQSLSGATQPAMMFLSNLNYVLIAVVGGMQVAAGALTVGGVQAFVQYSRQYSQPFSYLAGMSGMAQSGLASAERVFELLDAPEQAPDAAEPPRGAGSGGAGPRGASDMLGRVTFENVSFRYRPDRPLIEDLQLVAEPGHTVAIVGSTGAGKTTLVNLLMRFYEIDAGRITIDGVDIATMTRGELRSRIGMVLQDPWLFQGTIADNIAYGRPGATRADIVAAATAAHADRFVRTLPDGYDTLVDDDGGAGVSAGERQLLTIARAFLTETPMLVLDEATSSVDTRTELLIQRASARLREGRTAFVIAHRLSTIRDADTIVVMADGAIAEQGTHDELLGRDGAYARLYAAQFARAPAAEVT
ncbi:multidrug ABC transporter ATP-binding protein [Parafrankia colletiae]|uniref:Fatty acid ABC transporter ATP-binding/permease protein n=1 Tax=Parafrankia colletiae TaxID=573497 RepID=A0A1S1QG67_9ACTN|nr:ABC transporter ATP-binding protein [Parafrankia colletiae]MCK9902663.1 ABC transporter ATP-binding protein/permease [Frankia sp. Cpl3]OHV31264.1 multidrug ABC transporter ATP-binding protein [Parafrankia colletiae]